MSEKNLFNNESCMEIAMTEKYFIMFWNKKEKLIAVPSKDGDKIIYKDNIRTSGLHIGNVTKKGEIELLPESIIIATNELVIEGLFQGWEMYKNLQQGNKIPRLSMAQIMLATNDSSSPDL